VVRVAANRLLLYVACFIQYIKLDFEEFCAAAISVHQLEGIESWEQHQGMPMSCLRRILG
jgi:hypothetical protein